MTIQRSIGRFTLRRIAVLVIAFCLLALPLSAPVTAQDIAPDGAGPARLLLVIHDVDADRAVWIDGERRILSRGRNAYRLWDAETGDLRIEMADDGYLYAFALTSDQRRIMSSTRNRVRVWEVGTGEVLHEFVHPRSVNEVAWSPDGTRVLVTLGDTLECTGDCLWEVRLWDAETGALLHVFPQRQRSFARFSPDGQRVFTSNLDNQHVIWDAETGEPLAELGYTPSGMTQARWSRNSDRLLTVFLDGAIMIWDATTGAALATMAAGSSGFTGSAIWNAAETQVLSWSEDAAYLWDAATGEPVFSMPHTETVMIAGWDPAESRIFTSSNDYTVRTWDAATGDPLVTFRHPLGVGERVWWNAGGSVLMTAAADSVVRLWDSQGGALLGELPHKDELVWGAAWNAAETRVMTWASAVRTNNGGFVRVWDVSDWMLNGQD